MTTGNDKEETERLAMSATKVQSFLEGKQIRKIIVYSRTSGQYWV